MTQARRNTTANLYRDRPSRTLRQLPDGMVPVCPRCNEDATGAPGHWWCAECSMPVTTPRTPHRH